MDETISRISIEIGASSDGAEKKITDVTNALQGMRGHTKQKVRIDTKDVDKAHKKIGMLTQTLNALKRIAFYRLIRSAIKAVGEAFQEGAENAYWYSKTMGDSTKYIADAYDNLSSGSFKMTNQLGAAWATLKATLEPVLISIINLVTQAANAITQLFAALGGRTTYLKAIDYSKQWADTTKRGAAAAKEWKNQLLGFDEINRLEEPAKGGGGGGGAAMPDYENMFEEAKVSEWAEKISEHLELIKTLALGIGTAILAWKAANFLNDLFKIGAPMKELLGLAIAIGGAYVYVKGFMDAWNNGPDWDNIAEMLIGVTVAAIGMGLAFGPIAAAVTLLVGGIGMLVVGLKDWIKTGELSTETFWMLEAGIAAVGAGATILLGPWALLVAAIAAGALAIYQHWDDVKQSWENLKIAFDELIDSFSLAWDDLKKLFEDGWNDLKTWWEGLSLGQFHIPIPHFDWTYSEATGLLAEAMRFVGLPATIPHLNISWYAQGGFPEDGLFMANHGELVGQFSNGRTAVANNEQITEGIAKAVYEAFVEAFTQTNGSNGNGQPVNIYLDGKQIATTTTKYQTQMARATG